MPMATQVPQSEQGVAVSSETSAALKRKRSKVFSTSLLIFIRMAQNGLLSRLKRLQKAALADPRKPFSKRLQASGRHPARQLLARLTSVQKGPIAALSTRAAHAIDAPALLHEAPVGILREALQHGAPHLIHLVGAVGFGRLEAAATSGDSS